MLVRRVRHKFCSALGLCVTDEGDDNWMEHGETLHHDI